MFPRAKLWLDAVPPAVMTTACERGSLTGRLRLSDDAGWPVCASVRPPDICLDQSVRLEQTARSGDRRQDRRPFD